MFVRFAFLSITQDVITNETTEYISWRLLSTYVHTFLFVSRDLCKCGTDNTHTYTHPPTHTHNTHIENNQVQCKPFGLGHVATAAVSNQRQQSVGQVRPINCSKCRRVFVSSLLCPLVVWHLSLCLTIFLCLPRRLWQTCVNLSSHVHAPCLKINSSQCKLLPLGCRVISFVWLPPPAGIPPLSRELKISSDLWHNLYIAVLSNLVTAGRRHRIRLS